MTLLNQAIQRLKELQSSVFSADACKLAGAVERLEEHREAINEVLKHRDDLVAVCEEALTMIGHNHWDNTMQHGAGCELCIHQRKVAEKIRAAIAKAKGGAS